MSIWAKGAVLYMSEGETVILVEGDYTIPSGGRLQH